METKMSFESLNARISTLHETTKHVSILIERLQNLNFQPGSLPLSLDSDDVEAEGNVLTELSQEIRETLKEETESLEVLKEEVGEFPGGKTGSHNALLKESLEQMISRAQRDINISNTTFYDAVETAKQNLAAAQQLEKDIVTVSLKTPEPMSASTTSPISPVATLSPTSPTYRSNRTKKVPLTAEEKEVAASSDVTAALRRTHNLMLSELSRSQFANQTLEESTAALAELSEKYSTLDTLLAGSKNLLGSLLKSQKSDTWYLETAFCVLLATIGWLIFRRFIYGPAWWFVWLPIKYFYRILVWVFVSLGISGAGSPGATGVERPVESERPSLVAHPLGTRTPKVEGQVGRGRPPTITVGGGGKGAPMRNKQHGQMQEPKREEGSMVEEIGKIIDGDSKGPVEAGTEEPIAPEEKATMQEQAKQEERTEQAEKIEQQEEIIPNPKKRMFDTEVERKKEEEQWKKDEL